MTTKFVYSVSSQGRPNSMVKDAIRSIRSLERYVDTSDVVVFFTPPIDGRDVNALEQTGAEVVTKENEFGRFALDILGRRAGYGEMWNLCLVDADTVVWLDSDTVVAGDIWEVIDGDFDLKARPEVRRNSDEWNGMFHRHGKESVQWVLDAGFVIFKNRMHKNVKEEWHQYISSDLGYYGGGLKKDIQGLMLAASGYDLEEMSPQENVLEWRDERVGDGVVYHYITDDSVGNQLRGAVRRRLPQAVRRSWRKWYSKYKWGK